LNKLPELRFSEFADPLDETTLGTLLSGIEAGVSVNSLDRPAHANEPGVLKTSAVSGGRFLARENKAIVPHEVQRARTHVRAGSVLVSRINTLSLVGESTYIADDWPWLFLPDRLWQLTVDKTRADARWLAGLLGSPSVRARLTAKASGTSGSMKNISQDALTSLRVLVPSVDEQSRIGALLSVVDERIAVAVQRTSTLRSYYLGVASSLLGPRAPWLVATSLSDLLRVRGERRGQRPIDEVFSVAKQAGVINQIEHLGRSYSATDLGAYKVVEPGDVVFTKSPTAGFPYGIVKQNRTVRTGLVSPLYGVYEPTDTDTGALIDAYFDSPVRASNYLASVVTKGAKNTINATDADFLKGRPILIPVSAHDRSRATAALAAIDEQIGISRRRLALFIEFKRALLQKLY
jgi:type I restriction enzyme S subunit